METAASIAAVARKAARSAPRCRRRTRDAPSGRRHAATRSVRIESRAMSRCGEAAADAKASRSAIPATAAAALPSHHAGRAGFASGFSQGERPKAASVPAAMARSDRRRFGASNEDSAPESKTSAVAAKAAARKKAESAAGRSRARVSTALAAGRRGFRAAVADPPALPLLGTARIKTDNVRRPDPPVLRRPDCRISSLSGHAEDLDLSPTQTGFPSPVGLPAPRGGARHRRGRRAGEPDRGGLLHVGGRLAVRGPPLEPAEPDLFRHDDGSGRRWLLSREARGEARSTPVSER